MPTVFSLSELTKAELETLAKGIEIEKGKIAYADVELLEATNKESLLVDDALSGNEPPNPQDD